MLAAIRDASASEGQRIRGAIQAIRAARLHSEFARVAHFEWEGADGGFNMYAGVQNVNLVNRFWLADLEDFDERPVRIVKRAYSEAHFAYGVRLSFEAFRGVEAGVSGDERRRYGLLLVDTTGLDEAFGANVAHVTSRPLESGVNFHTLVRQRVGISDNVEKSEVRQETTALTQALAGDRPLVIGMVASNAPGEIPVPDDLEGILGYLRNEGFDDFASELEYKRLLIEEDPDELPIRPESARGFAGFVVAELPAGSPNVTVDAYGYVGMEWIIPDPLASGAGAQVATVGRDDDHVWGKGDGVLGLWFLPNGMVRVYGTSGPVGQGVERMRVNSTVTPGYVMSEVEPFLSRLRDL